MRRLLAVALAGILALAVVAGLATVYGAFTPSIPQAHIGPSPIGPPSWNERRRYSVNRVLIVEGESDTRENAASIAEWIVGPSELAFDEVLVYVRTRKEPSLTRRVQWTRAAGYRVLDFQQ